MEDIMHLVVRKELYNYDEMDQKVNALGEPKDPNPAGPALPIT